MSKRDYEFGSSSIEGYFRWMDERHRIYVKRQNGVAYPWTDDPILREYRFCNVFRELDKNTVQLRELQKLVGPVASDSMALSRWIMNVFVYRMFNRFDTFAETGLLRDGETWPDLRERLYKRSRSGEKMFTAAHMTTSRLGQAKIDTTCSTLDAIWARVSDDQQPVTYDDSMEETMKFIVSQGWYGIAEFIGYEIVCDLRFQPLLWTNNVPKDCLTWANIGPGARRGMERLGMRPSVESMRELWLMAKSHLGGMLQRHWRGELSPPLEMREIEHCLCEFDKYERARTGVGRPKQKYTPTEE